MSDLTQEAESAVKKLLRADEDQLYEQLGMRARALAQDLTKSASFEPQVVYDHAQMGSKEEIREFGQRLFHRWNIEAYKLVCGSDPEDKNDRRDLVKAFGIGETAVAAALSVLLVTQLGVAPALAAVIAAIVLKRFFRPAHEELCQVWKKKVND